MSYSFYTHAGSCNIDEHNHMQLLRDVSNPQSLDAGALFVRALKSEAYLSWPLYSFKFKCCREHKEDGDSWGALQKCVSHPQEGGFSQACPLWRPRYQMHGCWWMRLWLSQYWINTHTMKFNVGPSKENVALLSKSLIFPAWSRGEGF